MQLLLPALAAHQDVEGVQRCLLLATRLLLPASHPKAFVMGGGIELLGEALRVHATSDALAATVAKCLHMLASLNNQAHPP